MSAAHPDALDAKWRGAWPEWSLVEPFVPAAERSVAPAWHALQFELEEAAWAGEGRPGEAKLGWWSEELLGWRAGRRRHPLGAVLQKHRAPWEKLAGALPALAATRAKPATHEAAAEAMHPYALALAAVEDGLLGGSVAVPVLVADLLHARLARHPAEALPLDQRDAAQWATRIRAAWPDARGASTTRRLQHALARSRLARGEPGLPLTPWRALAAGWRGARH